MNRSVVMHLIRAWVFFVALISFGALGYRLLLEPPNGYFLQLFKTLDPNDSYAARTLLLAPIRFVYVLAVILLVRFVPVLRKQWKHFINIHRLIAKEWRPLTGKKPANKAL